MNRQEKNPNMNLERAITEMRADEPSLKFCNQPQKGCGATSSRMTSAGIGDSIRGCSDVKKLLVQYQAGALAEAKSRLVEAHLHECVDCRRFADAGNRSATAVAPWTQELPRMDLRRYRWVGAAAAVIVLLFSAYLLRETFFAVPAGMRASIVSLEGGLYRVGVGSEQPLKTGDEIGEGEKVRTGTGAHAMLRLRDGSQVEMNERAQLGVSIRNSDTTINLDRGKVIVQAAKTEKRSSLCRRE